MNVKQNDTYEVVKKAEVKRGKALSVIIVLLFAAALAFISFKVYKIYEKVSTINISNDKMEYVYEKIGDLVNVLDTKEDMGVSNYNPTEPYDFKGANSVNELKADQPADAAGKTDKAIMQEVEKMQPDGKLTFVRDRLVDIYQKAKTREDDLVELKQSFYDTKSIVQNWYNDKKSIKTTADVQGPNPNNTTMLNRLKENLSHFVEVSKVTEDANKAGKDILTADQVPQMLTYAELLLEAGSISQAAWIMEDIGTITKQQEITKFTEKANAYIDKYPNQDIDMEQIKDLIDVIENKQ